MAEIALGEVCVRRGDVDALTAERVRECRQGGRKGLAFSSGHLGDGARASVKPANIWTSKSSIPSVRRSRLVDERKSRNHHGGLDARAAAANERAELVGTRSQFAVGHRADCGCHIADFFDDPPVG